MGQRDGRPRGAQTAATERRQRAEPAEQKRYHHGDLRAALLQAAEAELAEKGMQGFTLRGCARRAGVSHAAPAHHFADVSDLLAEMAAIGFERLTRSLRAERAGAPRDPLSQFIACGRGYIRFALANRQHFSLMFSGVDPEGRHPRLAAVAMSAFDELVDVISSLTAAADPMASPEGRQDVLFAWSLVHGYAKLGVEQPLGRLAPRDTAALEADISGILERAASAIEGRINRP